MPGAVGERVDFFLSRRGSVAAVAQEVSDVLTAADYKVIVQDYDIPLGASFIEAMHEAVKNARGLIILFTGDYEASPYTRKEFTSFEAERLRDERDRHIVVLRCDDAPLRGLLADSVYQDLVGVADPEERKRRILAAAERRSSAERPQRRRGRTFVGVPPRIAGFTGRADELDRLDAILTQDRPAAVTQVGRAAVQGMGGVGKTALAVEYANRFRNLYDGVWWCSAETRAGLMTSLAALATELEAASPEEADIEKAARAALQPARRAGRHLAPRLRQRRVARGDCRSPARRRRARADHVALLGLERVGGRGPARRAADRGSRRISHGSRRTQRRGGRADACGGAGPAAAGARPCGGDVQADANELRRLCGEGLTSHRRGAARRALSAQRRRDLRSRDRRCGCAMPGGGSADGVSCVLCAGAHPLDPRRGRDRRRDRAHGGARRACRTVARQA